VPERARQATLHDLHGLAVASGGVREATEVARLAVEYSRYLLRADGAGIFTFDVGSGMLKPLQVSGPHPLKSVAPDEGAVGLAFQAGRPVYVPEYQTWDRALAGSVERGIGSVLAVPLVADGRTLGVIVATSKRPRHFSELQHLESLTLVAAQVAPLLRTTLAADDAKRRARMFGLLHELAVAAGGTRDPRELARIALEKVGEALGATRMEIWWTVADPAQLQRLAVRGLPPPEAASRALAARALRKGRAATTAPRSDGSSGLAIPLKATEETIGAVLAWNEAGRRFPADDVQLLWQLAAQIAPTLAAARLAAESDWRARTFAALHEVSVAAGGLFEPARLAGLAVDKARDLMDAESSALVWWDPVEGGLSLLADNTGDAGVSVLAPADSGAVRRAFRSHQPCVIADYPLPSTAEGSGAEVAIRSVAAVPLLAGERSLGALVVRSRLTGHFDDERMRGLTLLATQVAPALQAAGLLAERERQASAQAALRELAVAAGGVLEPSQLAQLAVERAISLFEVDRAALYWWDRESGQLVSLAASGPAGSKRLRVGQGAAGAAYQRGAPVLVEDYRAWEAGTLWAKHRGFQSALAVPLMVNDVAVGAVSAYSLRRRKFSNDDAALLSLLAAQVAPAVEAARLHAGLARSEERLRSAYETISCGIVVYDAGGRVVDANRPAEEMIGLRIEQMRGQRPENLWESTAESGEYDRPALAALVSRQPIRDSLVRITRRDGQVRWLQGDAVPVLDELGLPQQVVSSLIDVSARKRAENALRASEGRFRTVFDRAALGIARLSLEGAFLEANPALSRMLDCSPDDLAQLRVGDIIMPDDEALERFASLGTGDLQEFQAEIRCRRCDGSQMWGRAVLTLVRGAGEEPSYVIAMIEDITEHKAHAEALAHQAMHDPLTDLPNRTLLFDRLNMGIQISQRDGSFLALLLLDLDNFKDVNDSFASHFVGDKLLRAVADRLRRLLRASDTVARLGGDEFALVLMGVDGEKGAVQAAAKVQAAFEAPFEIEGERLEIGASVGIAIYPDHGPDADALMRRADSAMYAAKRSGRGVVTYGHDETATNGSVLQPPMAG
jgi:diguanylate cyclase (GGDEF)-like protein/PAS domain S-box-containing protein